MPLFSRLSSFWRNLFRKEQREQELAEEIDLFLELLIDQKIEQGLAPEEARRAALIELGGREQVREKVREVSAGHFLETWWRDLRFGLRVLRKSPAFTALAILTLTLGIGANTAIFSVVDAVLLRPLPYPYPDQLVRLYETNTSIADNRDSVSAPNFSDWRELSRSFSGMAALSWEALTLTGGAEAEFLWGQRVTPAMLNILGVHPAFGRDFSSDDAISGRDHVVLLSHELWTRRFAGDPLIIGRRIKLNFESYTVIGVLPPGFRTPSQFGSTEPPGLLLPLIFTDSELQMRGSHNYQVFARLRPTVTPAQAQVEMNEIAERLAKTYSNNQGRGVRVIPLLCAFCGGS